MARTNAAAIGTIVAKVPGCHEIDICSMKSTEKDYIMRCRFTPFYALKKSSRLRRFVARASNLVRLQIESLCYVMLMLFILFVNSHAMAWKESGTNKPRAGANQAAYAVLPAFPGAEGYGALAKGGRGGRIVEVTNLNDSGPGSLREAVTATGPRIVVFRVGGTIELQSDLIIKGEQQAYLTIAGQTAPGGGILLKKYGLLVINTHDIVIRHIRVRPGWYGLPDPRGEGISATLGSFGYGRTGILVWGQAGGIAHDVIFDHVSVSWQTDDNAIWENVWNVTVQWSIFSEGSRQVRDTYDCGGCGFLWGPKDQVQHLSFHHNLLINEFYRNPLLGGGEHQFINNLIYNPGWSASFLSQSTHVNYLGEAVPHRLDIIGNYYKKGPDTRAGIHEISFEIVYDPSVIQLHVKDNYGWSYDPNNPYAVVGGNVNFKRSAVPLVPAPSIPVTIHTYEDAKNLVINHVGATLPKRDAVDERLSNEFNTGTGRLGIGSDFPTVANGTPPSDSDHDGMPDDWENALGLNAANAADGNQDADGDGYTNVEEYLNELAGDKHLPPTFIANLNANTTSGQAPLSVQFSGSASGGKTPYTFKWDFGDGGTSNLQNPSHTYEKTNSYTATLTVTDGENKQASASRVITVAANLGNPPSVVGVRLTEVNQPAALSVINPDNWYDLYLYVDDPEGWNNLYYADIWLSHESNNEGTIANRGGRHFAASNYVMSYSIDVRKVWAKEIEGTATWTNLTGKLGLYVDDDNNEYEHNSIQKWAKARIKLLPSATIGNWTIRAYVIDRDQHVSNLFAKNFRVIAAGAPTASITLSDPSPTRAGQGQVILTTSNIVTKLPTPLIFTESDNSTTLIDLSGSVPGDTFTGIFVVDETVAEGIGYFALPADALIDVNGNKGNEIRSGAFVRIDKTPPANPQNVKVDFSPP